MSWTDGDLRAFAAGLAIGGEWNQVQTGFTPRIWNEEGKYDHFYIDFLLPVLDFSFGQITSSIRVMASGKLLTITSAVRSTPKVICLYVDISGQEHGVTVIGADQSKIAYADGGTVPRFVQTFQVAGLLSYVDYAWIFERGAAPNAADHAEEYMDCAYWHSGRTQIGETGHAPDPASSAQENVAISYFEV